LNHEDLEAPREQLLDIFEVSVVGDWGYRMI
jgi:hypothetical protein